MTTIKDIVKQRDLLIEQEKRIYLRHISAGVFNYIQADFFIN